MKTANVAGIRWRDRPGRETHRAADGIAVALRRYPEIDETERRALLRFVRRASRTEIRDRILRTGLEPKLIAFSKDHASDLRGRWYVARPWLFGLLLVATLLQLVVRM